MSFCIPICLSVQKILLTYCQPITNEHLFAPTNYLSILHVLLFIYKPVCLSVYIICLHLLFSILYILMSACLPFTCKNDIVEKRQPPTHQKYLAPTNSLSTCFFLSVVSLPTCVLVFIYLSIYLCACPSIYLSIHVCVQFCLFVYL